MRNDDDKLNKDVLGIVFQFLKEPKVLAKQRRVSKLWKNVSETENLWTPFLTPYNKKKTPQISAREVVVEQMKRQKELDQLLAEPSLNPEQKENLAEEKFKTLYLHGHITLEKFKNIGAEKHLFTTEICDLILNDYLDANEYLQTFAQFAQKDQYQQFYEQRLNLTDLYNLIISLGTRFPMQKKIIAKEIQPVNIDERDYLRKEPNQKYILESSNEETMLARLQEIKQGGISPSPIQPK